MKRFFTFLVIAFALTMTTVNSAGSSSSSSSSSSDTKRRKTSELVQASSAHTQAWSNFFQRLGSLFSNNSNSKKAGDNEEKDSEKRNTLSSLPPELLQHIVSYLEPQDFFNLAQVNKAVYEKTNSVYGLKPLFSKINNFEVASNLGIEPTLQEFQHFNRYGSAITPIDTNSMVTVSMNIAHVWSRNPETDTWSCVADLGSAADHGGQHRHHSNIETTTTLDANTVVTTTSSDVKVWMRTPGANDWHWTTDLVSDSATRDIVVVDPNTIIIHGYVSVVWARDPQTNSWTQVAHFTYRNLRADIAVIDTNTIINADIMSGDAKIWGRNPGSNNWSLVDNLNNCTWLSSIANFINGDDFNPFIINGNSYTSFINLFAVIDANTIAISLTNRTTFVWNKNLKTNAWKCVAKLTNHNDIPTSIATPDAHTLIFGSYNHTAEVWTRTPGTHDWHLITTLEGNSDCEFIRDIKIFNADTICTRTTKTANMWARTPSTNNWHCIATFTNSIAGINIVNQNTFAVLNFNHNNGLQISKLPTGEQLALLSKLYALHNRHQENGDQEPVYLDQEWYAVYEQLDPAYKSMFPNIQKCENIAELEEIMDIENSVDSTSPMELDADSKKRKRNESAANEKAEMTSAEYDAWQQEEKRQRKN